MTGEPSPFRPGSVIDRLRAETRARHTALERDVDLLGGACSLARYASFLRGTLSVVSALEGDVARYLGEAFGAPQGTTRTARLRHDLAALGAQPDTVAPMGGPAISTPARAFGAAYVLQGSLLGGTVIVRALRERIGLTDEASTYLRMHGEDTGRVWRAFGEALERFAATAGDAPRAAVVAAASETFSTFHAAMRREGLGA